MLCDRRSLIFLLVLFACLGVGWIMPRPQNGFGSSFADDGSQSSTDGTSSSPADSASASPGVSVAPLPSPKAGIAEKPVAIRYEFSSDAAYLSAAETARLRQSCSVADLERVAVFNNETQSWEFRPWCDRLLTWRNPRDAAAVYAPASSSSRSMPTRKPSPDRAPFRLDSAQLRALFQNQITVFVGDSVVRNHFVLTMARMCNERDRGKCMIMMPTFEYDVVRSVPSSRGPLGCKPSSADPPPPPPPKGKQQAAVSSPHGVPAGAPPPAVDSDLLFSAAKAAQQRGASDGTLTDCYNPNTTSFQFVPAPGLSSSHEPRRSERKMFLKKGIITPLIRMEVDNSVFYYVPVNTPKQIVRFAKWLNMKAGRTHIGSELLRAKTVFVSTGPHLSEMQMNESISLLKPALHFIQQVLQADSTVVLSETTHQLNVPPWGSTFVDDVMDRWREALRLDRSRSFEPPSKSPSPAGTSAAATTSAGGSEGVKVELVPQRFVTIGGFVSFRAGTSVREENGQELLRRFRRTCQYYDNQHPALPCQEVLTELMLMVAYASRTHKAELNMTFGEGYRRDRPSTPAPEGGD
jgi:hypothetical protein